MKKYLFFPFFFAALVSVAQNTNTVSEKFAASITPQKLQEKLTVIASAEMEGRETATPAQKRAAMYIENQFKKYGLKSGNADSYQMQFPVYQSELADKKLSVNGKNFEWNKDFNFLLNSSSNINATFENTVFAGFGIVDATSKINDYDNLGVKGKIVVVLDGTANETASPQGINRFRGPGSIFTKISNAQNKGAAGIVVVMNNFLTTHIPFPEKTMSLQAANTSNTSNTSFFAATISEEVASQLLGLTTVAKFSSLQEFPKKIYHAELKIIINKTTTELQSSNVLAILPGTEKKDEYVFLTAHYDHLGKHGDVIYYGADDDGSGTTAVLQMAETFAAAAKKGYKPKRNIVFMTVSGEEKGLWGSHYYSEHPIFSLDKTSADLNTDMIGRIDTERKLADTLNYVYVIGHDKLSTDLVKINEEVNNKFTHLTLDYRFDNPSDVNRIYYRSDHFNFARKGVPILFFYDGMLKADYHQPTDTVDKINFNLMAKRTQLIFLTAWEIANKDELLKRDLPLNMPASR